MRVKFRFLLTGLLASASQFPAFAQQVPLPVSQLPADKEMEAASNVSDDPSEQVIVVTGTRGKVIGDIPPEVQLNEEEIQAYGAGSISDLLDAISPLTQSGRGRGEGRPVMLINGRRISGFAEIRNLPPEAIERVDVMPEEVALKYGYRADQRVVNFVLRENFTAVTTEVEGGMATAGGSSSYEAEANILRINSKGRWNIEGEYEHRTPLLESERDIIQTDPHPLVDVGGFRTLVARSDDYSLAGTLNRIILGDVSATVNASLEGNKTLSLNGLPESGELRALRRERDTSTAHLGVAFNGKLKDWRWSLTGNFDRTDQETRIETDSGEDKADTLTQIANGELVVNGTPFRLPAGEVSTSFRIGGEHQGLRGENLRSGIRLARALSRDRANAQANIDLPIASRRNDVLAAIGDLSVNFNAEAETLSDFGTLRTLGGGINWAPIRQIRILASVTDEDGAPTMQQLGDPALVATNVRVFDYIRGETVDIDRLEGGNPFLLADNRRVIKLGLTAQPLKKTDLTFRADYTGSRILDPIASFPTATPEIEAAFPDRFTRDASGRLVSINARPINFQRSDRKELRWGLNLSLPLGKRQSSEGSGRFGGGSGRPSQAAPSGSGDGGARRPGGFGGRSGGFGGGGFGGGRPGGFGGGAGGGARLQLGLFHTWHFQDEIVIRDGVPVLDLLNGSAVGSRGGQPRHEVDLRGGLFKNGFGARFTMQWQSGTTVQGGPSGDLRFGAFSTANLRLFANLGQQKSLMRKAPWLKGTRVSIAIDNLFDSHLRVRDENGVTPLGYQPDLLDPLGRSVRLSIRKQF